MKWTSLFSVKEHTIARIELVGIDNRDKCIMIYAFNHMDGTPAYYDINFCDKEEYNNSDIKERINDETKSPLEWIAFHTKGSFDDAVRFVKTYVKDMGCDDNFENEEEYRFKVNPGDAVFYIADNAIHSGRCQCVYNGKDCVTENKVYLLWEVPDTPLTEEQLFLTMEEAELYHGDKNYDIYY